MRTTVELPPDLLRAAKARSAESGESLKTLLTRAVAAELDASPARAGRSARVELPLFGSPVGTRVPLTNRDLERVLASTDAERAVTPTATRGRSTKSKPR
jgi:hypothetical protein